MPGPAVTSVAGDTVTWRLADSEHELDAVRLWSDFDLGDTAFTRTASGWELLRPVRTLPPVDRLEYLFELRRADETSSVVDPGNPRRVGGAFGDHSWLALHYRPPAWLEVEPVPGDRVPLQVGKTPVGAVDLQIWSPAGTSPADPLPLLLSHDGPEMDTLGELTRYAGTMIALGRVPTFRVGLLSPGPRDERYAANPAYADALVDHVLAAVLERVATTGRPLLMGQSLGAVAALHAEWTHPGTFGGLALQSGSFFTAELDPQESGYTHWSAVTGFVTQVHEATTAPSTLPVAIGFGTAEENAANNRLLATTLTRLGCPVSTTEVRDGHTFTCWRDLLDPQLTDLIETVIEEPT